MLVLPLSFPFVCGNGSRTSKPRNYVYQEHTVEIWKGFPKVKMKDLQDKHFHLFINSFRLQLKLTKVFSSCLSSHVPQESVSRLLSAVYIPNTSQMSSSFSFQSRNSWSARGIWFLKWSARSRILNHDKNIFAWKEKNEKNSNPIALKI